MIMKYKKAYVNYIINQLYSQPAFIITKQSGKINDLIYLNVMFQNFTLLNELLNNNRIGILINFNLNIIFFG